MNHPNASSSRSAAGPHRPEMPPARGPRSRTGAVLEGAPSYALRQACALARDLGALDGTKLRTFAYRTNGEWHPITAGLCREMLERGPTDDVREVVVDEVAA